MCLVGFIIISVFVMLMLSTKIGISISENAAIKSKPQLIIYSLLFMLSVMTVLHIVDYRITLLITAAVLLICDKAILKKVDYNLLLTFAAFFIFVGNLERIAWVKEALSLLISGREFIGGVLLSQIISNVPAAMMLSSFTQNSSALLLGVNVGGLGTLVASLASLISFKLYAKSSGARSCGCAK